MPRELSKGGQRPTVKLSVWSHGRQKPEKGICMDESITFEPQNSSELKQFFEDTKEKYHEIWVVITKKNSKPTTHFIQPSLIEAKKTKA